MNLYQQIMFSFGAILLVFGMTLMVFRSGEGGLTKIKLPVVELELNGGALFVMVLGAGLMYFGLHFEASSPVEAKVAPNKSPNNAAYPGPQGSEKNALKLHGGAGDGAPSKENAALEDDAPRDSRKQSSDNVRKEQDADLDRADDAGRASDKQALQSSRKEQELAKERAAAEEAARRAAEMKSLERARKMAADALEELQRAQVKVEAPPKSQSAAIAPSAPVTQPVSPPSRRDSVGSASLWDHNGSSMVLVSEGKRRKFYYDAPREGLISQGVHNGTLLFEGTRQGNRYLGTAYLFSKGCSPVGFPVEGDVLNEHEIVVRGRAPNRRSCRTIGYSDSVLRFTYSRTASDYAFPADGE